MPLKTVERVVAIHEAGKKSVKEQGNFPIVSCMQEGNVRGFGRTIYLGT